MNELASAEPTPAEGPRKPPQVQGTRIFTGHLFRGREGQGWAFTEEPPSTPPEPVRRPARVAQMLALTHRLEAAIEAGEYRDRADLARQLGFTRARITQLFGLLTLAPDLQESILELESVDGLEPLSERALRKVVRCERWEEQRGVWRRLHDSQESEKSDEGR